MDLKFFFHRMVILSRRLKYALKGSSLLLSHKAQLYCFWTKHCLQVVDKRVWLTCNSFEGKILILKRLDAADRIQSSPISDCLIIFGLRNGNIYIIPYDLLSATLQVFDVAFCIYDCNFQSDYIPIFCEWMPSSLFLGVFSIWTTNLHNRAYII